VRRARCTGAPTARRLIDGFGRSSGQRRPAAATVPRGPQSHTDERSSVRLRAGRIQPLRRTSPHEAPDRSAGPGCGRRPGGMHAIGHRVEPGRAGEPVPEQPVAREPGRPREPEPHGVAVAVGFLTRRTRTISGAAGTPSRRLFDSALVTDPDDFVMVAGPSRTG